MSVSDAVSSAVRLVALRALAGVLAGQIDVCESSRDLASLAGRLQSVLAEIDVLDPPVVKSEDGIDEIAQRRSARRASAG